MDRIRKIRSVTSMYTYSSSYCPIGHISHTLASLNCFLTLNHFFHEEDDFETFFKTHFSY